METRKLAIVVDHCKDYGGISKALENMLRYIAKYYKEITIYVLRYDGRHFSIPENVKIEHCNNYYTLQSAFSEKGLSGLADYLGKTLAIFLNSRNYPKKTIYEARRLKAIEEKYDCVIAYNMINNASSVVALEKIDARRKILWVHNKKTFLDKNVSFFEKFYKQADAIVCVSNGIKELFLDKMESCRDMTTTIHNFYNIPFIVEQAEQQVKDFDETGSATRLLTIGNFFEQKGFDRLVPVVKKLLHAGHDIRWYIIGNGPLKEDVEKDITDNGLEDNIILLGYRENPYPYLQQCDMYVQPSYWEGYCTTTVEAKILCKPTVVTDIYGMKEQFINGQNGLIVESSVEGLFVGIKSLIEDSKLQEKFIENLTQERVTNDEVLNLTLNIIDGK